MIKQGYTAIFNDPEYWCGNKGYRPDPRNGKGYQNWGINSVRARYVADMKPDTVLDLGCALGFVVKKLRSQNISAFGVDVSDWCMEHIPQEMRPYIRKLDFTQGLLWPDQYLDMIVSFSVLEHIDPEKIDFVISEIKRVARRGVIAVTPGDSPGFSEDASHNIKQPLAWWREQFPPQFDVISDNDAFWDSRPYAKEVMKADGVDMTTFPDIPVPSPVLPPQSTTDGRKVLATSRMPQNRSTMQNYGVSPARQGDSLTIALVAPPFLPIPPVGYGGSEVVMYDLACGLRDKGHKVVVFASDESPRDRGYEVVGFGPALLKVQVDWMEAEKAAYLKIRDRLLHSGFDIIHTHDWFGFAYEARKVNPKLKVCHTHHGHIDPRWWKSSTPGFPVNLFAISEFMKAEFLQVGFQSRRVYNGVDMKKYSYQEKKGDRLLFVGRASTFKQPHVAIEVAKRLNMGLDLVCGAFVDDPNYLQQIRSACDGQQIRYIEEPPQEEKVRLMQNAKCLIAPSAMGEPFGLMNAEAMACGTPCIGMPDGAIPEVIEHGVTGFVCKSVDPADDDIIEAVKKIDTIKPLACRQRVEQMFSREIMATNYEMAYRDILAGREW